MPRALRVVLPVEEMRVDIEGDARRRVAQLPRHKDDIETLGDEQARECVPQVVKPKPRHGAERSARNRHVEPPADYVPNEAASPVPSRC